MKEPSELEEGILALVYRPGYQPLKPRVIAKKLGLPADETKQVRKAVKRLVRQGELIYAADHLVFPAPKPQVVVETVRQPDEEPALVSEAGQSSTAASAAKGAPLLKPGDRVTGVFRRTQIGHGFVRPSVYPADTDRSLDVFITGNKAADASSGDVVLVQIRSKKHSRVNPEGEVIEVIERVTSRFVGTYLEAAGVAFVQVDGKAFSQPIPVGDPGAKNAQPDDKVVIEMVRFPSHWNDGEAVIVDVLGQRGSPGVDTLSIIHEMGLPDEFAEETLQAARQEADRFDASIGDRRDLTGTTIITIDPIDARDFDDAISLERLENGHWLLGVHIADVSHFVQPKSAIDREAYERATSVYLPDRVLPMLPEIISNGLASLQPDKVRYTKTVFIEFTADGAHVATEPCSAAIKSCRRFAYEEVDDYLANREAWRSKLTPEVFQLVGDMHELAMILRARRFTRGALELSMREVKIDLDKSGKVSGAHLVENTESHQVIEEFMLSANEAVARLIDDHKLHFLRRVHQAPTLKKLKVLTEFVSQLGIETESLENRFELQKLLKTVAGQPHEHAVNYAVLRSMQRAIYSPIEEGHFALASDCYCHFTSPIRRYPDLTIHRLLDAIMHKQKPGNDYDWLAIAGEHCSEREQRAEAAERELVKVKLLTYMSERIGHELDGVITGVEEFGLFVQGVEIPAEGLVHTSSLVDDFYRYDRRSHSLTGNRAGNSFRLGDRVRVVVARVDIERRELDFRLVDSQKRRSPRAKLQRGAKKTAKEKKVKSIDAKNDSKSKPKQPKPKRRAKRKEG